MIRHFLYLLAFLATPALADQDELQYDPEILQSCVDSRSAVRWHHCIGLAAQRCTYGPDGSSTVGVGYCFDSEWRQWDAMLNDVYRQLSKLNAEDDAEMGDFMPSVPRLAPSLKDMQRAWIPFRDAACTYEIAHWGGGTGSGPASAGCLMHMTALQVIMLQERLETYDWERRSQ